MNRLKFSILVMGCIFVLSACNNSNSLKQANAEKVIRDFLTTHEILTPEQKLNPDQIILIEKPNVYSQFYTNVRVDVSDNSRQRLALVFDFKRSPNNKWVLQTVESADKNEELKRRVIAHKNLNILTQ